MSIATFKCRDEKLIKVPYSEFKIMDDFFLKNMILDCKETDSILELNEDFNVVNSIIESLRLKTLIYNNQTNLIYMLALGEKWCVPYWLLYQIRDDIQESRTIKMLREYEMILTTGVKRCTLCNRGFKISENHSDSCKRHTCTFDSARGIYYCCQSTDHTDHCAIGYHVPDHDTLAHHINLLKHT